MMSAIQAMAATLLEAANPGMEPKALIAAVRDEHPEGSIEDIVRAAFYALTDPANVSHDTALRLQEFAIGARGSEPDDEARCSVPGCAVTGRF